MHRCLRSDCRSSGRPAQRRCRDSTRCPRETAPRHSAARPRRVRPWPSSRSTSLKKVAAVEARAASEREKVTVTEVAARASEPASVSESVLALERASARVQAPVTARCHRRVRRIPSMQRIRRRQWRKTVGGASESCNESIDAARAFHRPIGGTQRPNLNRGTLREIVATEKAVQTILVLNGPNLNLLGTREPAVYGSTTLADVEAMCRQAGRDAGVNIDFVQSNHEGALVGAIHAAGRAYKEGTLSGGVFNPGAYTHTSVALHDAIKGVEVPVIELHISNVHAREAFRHHSYISPAAAGII